MLDFFFCFLFFFHPIFNVCFVACAIVIQYINMSHVVIKITVASKFDEHLTEFPGYIIIAWTNARFDRVQVKYLKNIFDGTQIRLCGCESVAFTSYNLCNTRSRLHHFFWSNLIFTQTSKLGNEANVSHLPVVEIRCTDKSFLSSVTCVLDVFSSEELG